MGIRCTYNLRFNVLNCILSNISYINIREYYSNIKITVSYQNNEYEFDIKGSKSHYSINNIGLKDDLGWIEVCRISDFRGIVEVSNNIKDKKLKTKLVNVRSDEMIEQHEGFYYQTSYLFNFNINTSLNNFSSNYKSRKEEYIIYIQGSNR
jgi:hypothetical protein